jgi:hypothetical protein
MDGNRLLSHQIGQNEIFLIGHVGQSFAGYLGQPNWNGIQQQKREGRPMLGSTHQTSRTDSFHVGPLFFFVSRRTLGIVRVLFVDLVGERRRKLVAKLPHGASDIPRGHAICVRLARRESGVQLGHMPLTSAENREEKS